MRRLALLVGIAMIAVACSGAAAAPTTTTAPVTTSTPTTTTTLPPTSTTTTTLPPTTTTTTEPAPTTTVPIDPQFALMFDGFEQFGRLGEDATGIIDAFTAAFGEPVADSGWKVEHSCSFDGPLRTVVWSDPGVRVVFGDGESDYGSGEHLVTYTTLRYSAGPSSTSPLTPWRLFGLTRGMNLSHAEDLFPDAQVIPGPSLDYVQFDPGLASYAWVYDSGEIRDFWGGTEYCTGG